ncbi:bestrophin family ion channel [Shimia sp. SDUM112013]|uniref:bestrophin family protein n=1 Tax=Shimia sp. SDUM112013 TaxID=3136160 RepID=UPI0032EDFC1B
MIVRDTPRLFELLFAVRGSVLPRISPRILGFVLFSVAIVIIDSDLLRLPHTSVSALAGFGIALSLFLGFRNNAAYDRWWEGRRLWGQLIADVRSLGRETDLFLANPQLREKLLRTTIAFLHLHRMQLRKLPSSRKAQEWCGESFSEAPHPPCAAMDRMNEILVEAKREGALDGFGAKALTERLSSIAFAQAGCERIATTPLPFVYSLLVFRTTYLYALLLPFALLDSAGWMTPVFVGVVAYVFFGLAEVTEELAHPFGETVNSLPLDAMCRTMEISISKHLNLIPPAPLKPDRFYLS